MVAALVMSFFTALLLGFVLGDILWWLTAVRRLRGRGARITATIWFAAMLGGLALIIGNRFSDANWDSAFPRPVLSAIFAWHLLAVPLWLIWRAVRLVANGARRVVRGPVVEPESAVTRREFLATASTFAPAILIGGAAAVGEAQLEQFRTRRLDVPIAGLPPALEGLTIAHVSDLHIGRFTRAAVVERIVRATNDLDADLALLTGDLINFALRDLPAGMDFVRGLRAKHGVFLCEGNHDLIENGPAFRRAMLRADLPFLRGETETLTIHGSPLQIFGLPWTHGSDSHSRSVAQLAPLRRSDAFPILLAHHPHAFDFAQNFPLTLAGHTHGGQLMLNEQLGFGPVLFRYWSGVYRRDGRTLVVSNGVGNWFPIRIAAPAEILHLTLRSV
jgi:predicted MPP superfamily phosphohydrolase